ncbi:MAG: sulfatase, partial [Kiritimatiellaeota bacterium]|nr:sulfatase [Kiritimatiellota bacterium]
GGFGRQRFLWLLCCMVLTFLPRLGSGQAIVGKTAGTGFQPSLARQAASGGQPLEKSGTARPNIVYIMADDHGRQAASCYGSQLIQTPNIDRLARGGIRFTEMMACNSICSPSRATLITGKYNHLCGVERLDAHFDRSQQTFPKLLQQAGYQTAIVGKWHLFSEPAGFDFFSVLPGHGRYTDAPFKESGQPWGDSGNKGGVIRQGYVTDVITDTALDWLKRCAPDKPFCLMIHHKAPHSPHIAAPRHQDLFKDKTFPEPPNLLDDYAGRAPSAVANQLIWSRLLQQCEPQYQPIKQQFTGDRAHDTRLMYQEYMRNYLRLVVALDENVGRVLDYLDQSGLARNTVVVYTSDNGYFLGEHGFYNKMWMYEEALHLPLLVRLPPGLGGAPAGSLNHELVAMLDVAPTLLDLAGVKVLADIQGRSFLPLLRGETAGWRQAFYYHYYGTVGAPRDDNWIASHEILGVRTKSAKLVFYPTWKGGAFWEYFDLTSDPREMRNLYDAPEQQARAAELKQQLRGLAVQYQDVEAVKMLDENRSKIK